MTLDGDLKIPGVRLVLAIADPAQDHQAIRTAFESCADWDGALRLAAKHNLLYRLAVLACREKELASVLPPDIASRLKRLRDGAIYRDRLQVLALAQVIESLRAQGISPMLLKGQGLAERLYNDPAERISVDIDILVPESSIDEATRIVESLGYKALLPQVFRKKHFHICCLATDRSMASVVEVHWDVTRPGSLPRFPVERWRDEVVAARIRAGDVLFPPAVDELAYLCFHAFQRGTVTLRDLADLVRYVRAAGLNGNMASLAEKAGQAGALEYVNKAFSIASALWGVAVPGLPRPVTHPGRSWLARNLFAPETITRWGLGTWWPFQVIRLWSLVPRQSLGLLELIRKATRPADVPGQGESAAFEPLKAAKKTAAIMLALLLCCLPLSMFPLGIRSS